MKKILNSNMKHLSLVLISSAAFMFAACGESGDGASPQSNADMDVRTYSDLPSCAEKRDGKTAYVADQEQGYICQNGKWVEDDDVKVVDYPSSSTSLTGNLLTDTRDGQTYKTVTIGTQTWLAENLNYKTDNSYCYDDKASNCSKYGRLYTWAAAITACPTGWHLPTKAEFETLITAVGGRSIAGTKLKSTSGWTNSGNGADASSFSALPAGYRGSGGSYIKEGYYANFWSSTGYNSDNAYFMYLYYNDGNARLRYDYENHGLSVRCVKD